MSTRQVQKQSAVNSIANDEVKTMKTTITMSTLESFLRQEITAPVRRFVYESDCVRVLTTHVRGNTRSAPYRIDVLDEVFSSVAFDLTRSKGDSECVRRFTRAMRQYKTLVASKGESRRPGDPYYTKLHICVTDIVDNMIDVLKRTLDPLIGVGIELDIASAAYCVAHSRNILTEAFYDKQVQIVETLLPVEIEKIVV